jgi:hypothetical protein
MPRTSNVLRSIKDLAGSVGTVLAIGILIGAIVIARGGSAAAPDQASDPSPSAPAVALATGAVTPSPVLDGELGSATPRPEPSPSPEPSASPEPTPTDPPTAEPTSKPTPKPTPRRTPKPTPWAGGPSAKPGTTPLPTAEGDIIVRGDLGSTLEGGGITTKLEFVAWGVPDWNICEPEAGWEMATYQLTTTYSSANTRRPVVMTSDGNANCWMSDSNTPYEISGTTYVYLIPQKSHHTAVNLMFESPPGVSIVFKFH